ncbi:hypothetical protein WJX72_004588 [[Myrmecia] bisecta]|uniref:Signal peptidase complex catalytic subunit SEC11 n=1 Tax=[Myrmecia] bisecta TaxID=41462 RepID=A0AAW1PD15_9CHLO
MGLVKSGKDFLKNTKKDVADTNKRQMLMQVVNLGLIVTSALMIWKSLILFTGSESPVVVVLSGSMEPGFYRGDILFLHFGRQPIRPGEIVVFNINGRDIPIVHRAIKVHEKTPSGQIDILTKGDNNWGDDRSLYNKGQMWLHHEHIMGRVVGYLPYVGQVTIIMNDYPMVKYALIGILGLFVLTSKE